VSNNSQVQSEQGGSDDIGCFEIKIGAPVACISLSPLVPVA